MTMARGTETIVRSGNGGASQDDSVSETKARMYNSDNARRNQGERT
jgi:hypothetical protein